jgi:hypothetical protein
VLISLSVIECSFVTLFFSRASFQEYFISVALLFCIISFRVVSIPISFHWWWKPSEAQSRTVERMTATRTLLGISFRRCNFVLHDLYIPLLALCSVRAYIFLFRLPATSPRRRSVRPSTANCLSCHVHVLISNICFGFTSAEVETFVLTAAKSPDRAKQGAHELSPPQHWSR